MSNNHTTVYQANTIAEIQQILKNIKGVEIVAGCTDISSQQTGYSLHFSPHIVPLALVPEMCTVSKTERYVEFGACVTLQTILQLGEKNVPEVLYNSIRHTANTAVRTIATLGGNIAVHDRRMSSFASLLALDARLEIRNSLEAIWIPMIRYFSNTKKNLTQEPEFISRIRVPTESWDIAIHRRLGPYGIVTEETASFVFMVKSQKNILADIRIAYAGKNFFRSREFENLMIGRSLPFSDKDIINLMDKAELFFDRNLFPPAFERKRIFNLLEDSLSLLA
jgi:CO/xanthine dehydrogenase FAD-binding subunit